MKLVANPEPHVAQIQAPFRSFVRCIRMFITIEKAREHVGKATLQDESSNTDESGKGSTGEGEDLVSAVGLEWGWGSSW